jgi:large subunit ribosomal protein L22
MSRYTECAKASTTERISPRKLNLIASAVRGLDARYAIQRLEFMKQRAAPIVKKVISAAVANASHTKGIDAPTIVLRAEVGSKGILRRARPGHRGSPAPIRRYYSHLRIVLGVASGEDR